MKYEKPTSLDAGQIAAIRGASCSLGNIAEGCAIGNNPDVVYLCVNTGNIADGNCESNGNTAGSACFNGGTPLKGRCYSGSTV